MWSSPCDNRSSKVAVRTQHVINITVNRQRSVLALFQAYAEDAIAKGAPPKGLEQAFASHLEISPSMWSQIKSSRPIGDKLARQIEKHASKPSGWLDEERQAKVLSSAEQQFLALALKAWRTTNGEGRKALKGQMKTLSNVKSRGC